MIRIAITQAAFDAIARTLPVGSVAYEAANTVWLDDAIAKSALRRRL
jgi:hypothetical protein